MSKHLQLLVLTISTLFLLSLPGHAEEISREQIKGLDEQVQEIKGDVLSIAADLNQIEEKLLYPSQTQVAIFISLAEGDKFRLDSIDLQLGDNTVAHHLYSYQELEALRKGGVQRLYTGNLRTGDHPLQVDFKGKSEGGDELQQTAGYSVQKGVGPKIVEITLARQTIIFSDR